MEHNNTVETVQTVETEEIKRLTMGEKLKYFFTKPNRIFEDYNIKPTWLLKLFIIVGLMVVITVLTKQLTIGPSIDMALQQTPDLPKEQAEAMVAMMNSPIVTIVTGIFAAIVAVIAVFLVPLIYWGLISLFGGKTNYMKIVAVYTLAYIPYCIGSFVTIGFAYFTNNYESLLYPQMTDVLFNRLGLFVIWQLLLLVFGLPKISKNLSLAKSAVIVAIMWLLGTGTAIVPVLLNSANRVI